jgi:hypothetical protein
MRYGYVENNAVVEIYGSLPRSWRNYSNFNLIDVAVLPSIGWYEVVDDPNPPSVDVTTHRIDEYYTFNGTNIAQSFVVSPLAPEDQAQAKVLFLAQLRDVRNSKLRDSDWTQTIDILEVKGQTWVNAWKTYRAALRNLPGSYESDGTLSLNDVTWPTEPSSV